MKWEFDADAGSLYVSFNEQLVDHQEEMPDGVLVDVDADGRAVGIEVLSAWAPVDWLSIIRRYHLDENDAASLEFLVIAFLNKLSAPGDRSSSLQADADVGATVSPSPAVIVTPAA
jgi:uncharacterized protein YuzE